jgi:hypothetical protein
MYLDWMPKSVVARRMPSHCVWLKLLSAIPPVSVTNPTRNGTKVGGTAVGGTAVAGTVVGRGTVVGGTGATVVVTAGPHAVNSITTTAITAKIVLILFIYSLLVLRIHGFITNIQLTALQGMNLF